MLNMYSDHYRLTANHVDGARARRFRIGAKRKPRAPITTTGPARVPKEPRALLDLLKESCVEAERVALTTGFQRHLRLAELAQERVEEFRKTM